MNIDPETGIREDGAICASAKQQALATESLKLRFEIESLEKNLPQVIVKNPDAAKETREAIRIGYRKLTEIDRQARAEQERLNKLRFPNSMADQKKNFVLWLGAIMILCVAAVVWGIVDTRPGTKRPRIIAEVYNSGTGELAALVYATNAQHRFQNGKTGEGWLMRAVDVPGSELVWSVKPTKATVVWRE